MNSQDIKHLANLSRLHLTDEEADAYTKQFDEIVGYVNKIKEISAQELDPRLRGDDDTGSRDDNANILREDEVSSYLQPESIIDEAPSHQDNFVKVKKILNQ